MPETDAAAPAIDDDLSLLREVAAEAGRIALRYFRRNPEVWLKNGHSPVSEADYAVDTFLRDTLVGARPSYGWLSEETADSGERLGRARTFVVDPIDGTRGFLEGQDRWCISIAVVEKGRPLAGVLGCPARGETFWAMEGGGAYREEVRLRVQKPGELLQVGGPKPMVDLLPAAIRQKLLRVQHVPSLAYRIAMIASNALDATFVKPNAHDWDLAAADLILAEAGGELRDRSSGRPRYGGSHTAHGPLVAGSGAILEAMSAAIRDA